MVDPRNSSWIEDEGVFFYYSKLYKIFRETHRVLKEVKFPREDGIGPFNLLLSRNLKESED